MAETKLFYTGKGDAGVSDIQGKKIDKASLEIEAVGSLDELNSFLGLVKTQSLPEGFGKILDEVQENLFIIQAHIGVLMIGESYKAPRFAKTKITAIEKEIDVFEKKVKPEKGFIVPGSNEASSWLDVARTIARRVEITAVKLQRRPEVELEPNILAYLNRLSSLLYAMARYAALATETRERHPSYK